MTISRFSVAFALCAAAAAAQDVTVPSGTAVTLMDVIIESEPSVARFRFLAPDIGTDGKQFADLVDDFEYLCNELARPALAENGWDGDSVVVSMSGAEVPFGEASPDVLQFFQPFQLGDGACQWEDY